MKKTPAKKRNPQDTTLRNTRAAKKRDAVILAGNRALEARVVVLERSSFVAQRVISAILSTMPKEQRQKFSVALDGGKRKAAKRR